MSVTAEPIMKIAMGFMAAKYLFAATEIGLFDALARGPASLEELASSTGIPFRTLGIVAAAMVSLGLLEQDGSRYRNSETAAAFLAGIPGSPDLRPMLRYFDEIVYPKWEKFAEAVRTDQGQPQFGKFTAHQQQLFSAAVEVFSAPGAAALAASYDFGRHYRVLDIAGGTGSFLIKVLRSHNALKGTLFELPGACAVARHRLEREPERSRIDIVEGDVFKDPIPDGHDVLIVANVVHVFSTAHNVELMRKIRMQVVPGARLLLVDLWMDPSHTQPSAAALMSGQFLLTSGEGQAYSEQEADEWLAQTRWKKLDRKTLAGPASCIIAEAI
jgi:ubiquinone/menaquinone biosynthesis C-methylase UbiE